MSRAKSWRGVRIYTIGHSTRTLDELVALLRTFGVSLLVDIRTIPRSRHNPQFNADSLRVSLRAATSSLCASSTTRRPAPRSRGITERGMAQRQLPRVRRLHDDGGVRGRPRGASDVDRERHRGSDVRRGGSLALSSLPGRGRPGRSRSPCRGHHRFQARDAAPPDAFRDREGRASHLSGRGRRAVPPRDAGAVPSGGDRAGVTAAAGKSRRRLGT